MGSPACESAYGPTCLCSVRRTDKPARKRARRHDCPPHIAPNCFYRIHRLQAGFLESVPGRDSSSQAYSSQSRHAKQVVLQNSAASNCFKATVWSMWGGQSCRPAGLSGLHKLLKQAGPINGSPPGLAAPHRCRNRVQIAILGFPPLVTAL